MLSLILPERGGGPARWPICSNPPPARSIPATRPVAGQCRSACTGLPTGSTHRVPRWVAPGSGASPPAQTGCPRPQEHPRGAPGERRLWQAHAPISQMLSNDNGKISSDLLLSQCYFHSPVLTKVMKSNYRNGKTPDSLSPPQDVRQMRSWGAPTSTARRAHMGTWRPGPSCPRQDLVLARWH